MPQRLPVFEIDMDARQAKRFMLLGLVFAALSIVFTSVSGMGFLPRWAMQLASGSASIFTGLSWLMARRAPSSLAAGVSKES